MQPTDPATMECILAIRNSFPRIGNALMLFWGEAEFAPYVDTLINDTRSGTRQGFPADVIEMLITLLNAHDVAYPQYATPYTDIWSESTFGQL